MLFRSLDGVEHELKEIPDDNIFFQFYSKSVYKKYMKIKPCSECKLSVNYKNSMISSKSAFPNKIPIKSAEVSPVYETKNFNLRFSFKFELKDNLTHYFRIKIVVETESGNNIGLSFFNPLYFTVSREMEQPIIIHFKKDIYDLYPGFNKNNFNYKNVYVIFEQMNEDYHNFRQALKVQKEDDDSPWGGEITQIPTNIKDGFGIFTCITRDTVCANIIH